jgi:hypothetical protein
MEFFNRKEEVLDVELTQYGKYLLSVGKFKPSFYAFFDDDVTYDTRYQGDPPKSDDTGFSGPTENQKDSQKRIIETPRVKTQHNYVTVDETHKQTEDEAWSDNENPFIEIQEYGKGTVEKLSKGINFKYIGRFKNDYYGVSLPLGTSDLNSEYAPSWQVSFIQSQLKSSATHSGGDGDEKYGIKKIPQLEIEVTFNTSVGFNQHSDVSDNVVSEATPGSKITGTNNEVFANGNFVKIEEDYILLDIQELNGLFGIDNFEIEVFEEVTPSGPVVKEQRYLRQLNFLTEKSALLYELEEDIQPQEVDLGSNLSTGVVDYYFEVSVDDEIQEISDYESAQVNTALNELEPCEDDV